MKKLYISSADKPGHFFLSPCSINDEAWENNHTEVDLLPRKRDDHISVSVEINILSNLLFACGVSLINEETLV